METKINLVEILKDKPKGIILYSPIFGECRLITIYEHTSKGDVDHIGVKVNYTEVNFDETGKFTSYGLNPHDDGEILLFPSKKMRDWRKFSWKKGDVLVGVGQRIIFEKFIDENYTKFQGKYSLSTYEDRTLVTDRSCYTSNFSKINDSGNVEDYFKDLEEKLGGKINRETLEIEKQLEFKDGDIVFMKGIKSELFANCIFILKGEYKDGDERAFYYAFYNADDKFIEAEYGNTKVHYSLRLATDSEKQQLFDALSKKGKRWDAEKKAIVDLPKKCEFKPMDWCLMRDIRGEECFAWSLCQFAYQLESGRYEAVGGMRFDECIPYNESTKHLLGTTDEWKGGEG